MSKEHRETDEFLGDEYKRPGLSFRAVAIGLSVVAILAFIPWLHGKLTSSGDKFDEAVYTAKAVNFSTEEVIAVGTYKQLLNEYMGSHGMGYPGTEEGSFFWNVEEAFAPFLSTNVDDFIVGTREQLAQTQFLSMVVQWQELNSVLELGYAMPNNYVEFARQLEDMEVRVYNTESKITYWEIPEDLILEKPLDAGYHAMMWYRNLLEAKEIFGTTEDIMFLHQYGGSPELTDWAFAEEAVPGDRAVIGTLYGDIEVLLYGYVSSENVQKHIESKKVELDPRLGQYYEKLKQWSLLSP